MRCFHSIWLWVSHWVLICILSGRSDDILKRVARLENKSIYFGRCQGLCKAVSSADEFVGRDGLGLIQERQVLVQVIDGALLGLVEG